MPFFLCRFKHGLQGVSSIKWRSNFGSSNNDTQLLKHDYNDKICIKLTKLVRKYINIRITLEIYTKFKKKRRLGQRRALKYKTPNHLTLQYWKYVWFPRFFLFVKIKGHRYQQILSKFLHQPFHFFLEDTWNSLIKIFILQKPLTNDKHLKVF